MAEKIVCLVFSGQVKIEHSCHLGKLSTNRLKDKNDVLKLKYLCYTFISKLKKLYEMALYETEACQSAVLAAALTGSNLPWSEAINNYVCE